MNPVRYLVGVVGAGPGDLSAAAHLGKHGRDVVVPGFER